MSNIIKNTCQTPNINNLNRLQIARMKTIEEINPALREFVEMDILPLYDTFDKAHRRDHALTVIEQSLHLASYYPVNINIVYAIAAFHDTGLQKGRELHHKASATFVRECKTLRNFFTANEIETIADATEDHRASSKQAPRTIYGKIVAEADRIIDCETIIRRTIQYGIAHYPKMDSNEHFIRACEHLQRKYARGGYLRLWIPESPNTKRLEKFQDLIEDKTALQAIFYRIFKEECGLTKKSKIY